MGLARQVRPAGEGHCSAFPGAWRVVLTVGSLQDRGAQQLTDVGRSLGLERLLQENVAFLSRRQQLSRVARRRCSLLQTLSE